MGHITLSPDAYEHRARSAQISTVALVNDCALFCEALRGALKELESEAVMVRAILKALKVTNPTRR